MLYLNLGVCRVLYWLLVELKDYLSPLNVFRYQTFRAMVAFLFSFVFVISLEPLFISWLKKNGVKGQPIRDDGPKSHADKRGTPTMGGAVIIVGIILAGILFCDLTNKFVLLSLFSLVGFGALGLVDDWRKISQQNTKGVSGIQKLSTQTIISLVIGIILLAYSFNTSVHLPFLKDVNIDLGFFFLFLVPLVIVGSSNAVNLTDGLDGLAIVPIMTVAATYAVFTYLSGNVIAADYLGIAHIPGVGELSIMLGATVGAGLGFLWYNTFPAQVFMGDMGALGLGGFLGTVAILVKQEVVLVIAGGIFVMEALSVIMQRYYFKATKKRIFRMAPLHHHFELTGLSEPKIIVRFWIVSIVLALISLTTLKLR